MKKYQIRLRTLVYIANLSLASIISFFLLACESKPNGFIAYKQVELSKEEKEAVLQYLENTKSQYDAEVKLLTSQITAWNAHTDIRSGTVHPIVGSLYYALGLLNSGDEKNAQEAFLIIEKALASQDTDPNSKTCGVWPYHAEESLATLKSIVDGNMADFNAATLLDIYVGHQKRIPAALSDKIKNAIILAANFIQKRNVDLVYTNIAIMGTNVTYVASHLFDLPEMKVYAKDRLERLYAFTEENGFAEYNSPDYMLITLDELERMQRYIVEPGAKAIVDSLYSTGWKIAARHFHEPSAQWAGPNSRSYNETATKSYYGLLYRASSGKIDLGVRSLSGRTILNKHKIPDYLLSYYLTPTYPRTEKDIFEKKELDIRGTTYLTDQYAISSATKSSMWFQRRPLLAFWGNQEKPRYMRPKLLMGFEELSSATIFCDQKDNNILSAVNFATNGAFRHLLADELHGKLITDDLRLRFEFGNTSAEQINIPLSVNAPVSFGMDDLQFNLRLFYSKFHTCQGYWEKGGDGKKAWLDFVIYSGEKKELDLNSMDQAVFAFTFQIASQNEEYEEEQPVFSVNEGMLDAGWKGLQICIPVKPGPRSKYLYL